MAASRATAIAWVICVGLSAIPQASARDRVAAAVRPADGADCPRATSMPVPRYPPVQVRAQVEGGVILVLKADRCGRVDEVVVERSSRIPAFDVAAVEAVRGWVMPVAGLVPDAGGRIAARVPFEFRLDGPVPGNGNDAERVRASWCGTRSPSVAADKGMLPAYIPDPRPLTGSIDTIVAGLHGHATYLPRANSQDLYMVRDLHVHEEYRVFLGSWPFAPSLLRLRRVHDGVHAFTVSSTLCEAVDPAACAKFEAFVRSVPKPQPLTPAPALPVSQVAGASRSGGDQCV